MTARISTDRCTSQFIVREPTPRLTAPAALAASSGPANNFNPSLAPNDELTGLPSNAALFQPIFEIVRDDIRLFSVECLTAQLPGKPGRLQSVFREASTLPSSVRTHINADSGMVARDPGLAALIAGQALSFEIPPARIVVEVSGYTASIDGPGFRTGLRSLSEAGFGVAIDDVGSGYSSYRMILDCQPDYLKINRYLIAGIQQDTSQQIVVRAIARLAREFGARVIADGVEYGPEFSTLRELGVDLIQGSLLAGPRAGSAIGRTPVEVPCI